MALACWSAIGNTSRFNGPVVREAEEPREPCWSIISLVMPRAKIFVASILAEGRGGTEV